MCVCVCVCVCMHAQFLRLFFIYTYCKYITITNIGYIPYVIQLYSWTYFMCNVLCIPLPNPYIAPPLHW